MAAQTPGKHGIADMWYRPDGSPTKLAEPDSSPRRPRGEGSRWRAWYIDTDGKERTKRFATKQPAEDWLSAQTADLTKGTWISPERSGESFGTVAAEWLASKKTSRSPKTVAGYESLLDTVILGRWRSVPLKDMKHGELQQWITDLSTTGGTRKGGTGLSASRVRQAHQVISAVLRYAIRTERLVKNVATDIDLPVKQSAPRRYLTHKQLQQLAAKADRFEALTLVLGYCGLRIGEAIALRRRDIGNRTITVRTSVTSVTGQGQVEGDTKTHRGREVPVPAFVWERLKGELPDDPDALVFPSRKGGHLTIGEYRWVFDSAASDIALGGLVPHELRHTCASLAISAGANVKAVQTLLGHASAVMTLDLYGHLLSDDLTRVARSLDRAARRAAA
ncbi:site-specific integrase [Mycobacterium sp. 852002-30065_SCH5024008]|uniref:tyrosine-type recombinase/integrase n=1 Tax=Mycobacterium sp. 852002-30065_SCH5024008 TaxID=1834088 RepID=UPI0009EE3483|nr:site-specific integrase [Mycobacterium sp. 852002-30065_SCH5024008]